MAVDKWFARMVVTEFKRHQGWNEAQDKDIRKLLIRQAIIWFILGSLGTLAGIALGALLS